jgi:hypothetical protein
VPQEESVPIAQLLENLLAEPSLAVVEDLERLLGDQDRAFLGVLYRMKLGDSRARVVIVELATRLVMKGVLPEHPAAKRLDLMEEWIADPDGFTAFAACAALAHVPGERSLALLERASSHSSAKVRLEANYARAKMHVSGAETRLASATLDPVLAATAGAYLEELKLTHLIPKEAWDPTHMAKCAMVTWLMHPNEYGAPPTSIELWDRRRMFWPPTKDERELFLFRFKYDDEYEQAEGAGLVGGAITWSLSQEAPIPATPEEAYVQHCMFECAQKRVPGASTPAKARQLLGFRV